MQTINQNIWYFWTLCKHHIYILIFLVVLGLDFSNRHTIIQDLSGSDKHSNFNFAILYQPNNVYIYSYKRQTFARLAVFSVRQTVRGRRGDRQGRLDWKTFFIDLDYCIFTAIRQHRRLLVSVKRRSTTGMAGLHQLETLGAVRPDFTGRRDQDRDDGIDDRDVGVDVR